MRHTCGLGLSLTWAYSSLCSISTLKRAPDPCVCAGPSLMIKAMFLQCGMFNSDFPAISLSFSGSKGADSLREVSGENSFVPHWDLRCYSTRSALVHSTLSFPKGMLAEGKEMVCLGWWVSHCWLCVRPSPCKMIMCYSGSTGNALPPTRKKSDGKNIRHQVTLPMKWKMGFLWGRISLILETGMLVSWNPTWSSFLLCSGGEKGSPFLCTSSVPVCSFPPFLPHCFLLASHNSDIKRWMWLFDRDIQRWQNAVSSWVAFLSTPYLQTCPITHASHLLFSNDGRNQNCVFVSIITIAAPLTSSLALVSPVTLVTFNY